MASFSGQGCDQVDEMDEWFMVVIMRVVMKDDSIIQSVDGKDEHEHGWVKMGENGWKWMIVDNNG